MYESASRVGVLPTTTSSSNPSATDSHPIFDDSYAQLGIKSSSTATGGASAAESSAHKSVTFADTTIKYYYAVKCSIFVSILVEFIGTTFFQSG